MVIKRTALMKRSTKLWTDVENERLRALVEQGISMYRAAAIFNRSVDGVVLQARKLGSPFPRKFAYRKKFDGEPSDSWRHR